MTEENSDSQLSKAQEKGIIVGIIAFLAIMVLIGVVVIGSCSPSSSGSSSTSSSAASSGSSGSAVSSGSASSAASSSSSSSSSSSGSASSAVSGSATKKAVNLTASYAGSTESGTKIGVGSAGLIVEIEYEDGSKEQLSTYTIKNGGNLVAAETRMITISAGGLTFDLAITCTTPKPPTAYGPKMYQVGRDIPAGEYIVVGSGYYAVLSDTTGSLDAIVTNDNIKTYAYVSATEGQYLELSRLTAYLVSEVGALANIPKLALTESSGAYKEGTYKVGVDIPAGTYDITPTSSSGYYAVLSDSYGGLYSIVANNNFSGGQILTVFDGQYLELSRAKATLR